MGRLEFQGIDLFAGAGGLSAGATLAGIKVTHAVENNHAAAATYRANHPETTLLEEDIRGIDKIPCPAAKVKFLFGGPPCQGFSTSNQRTRSVANPKNWLFNEFFRLASHLRPDWIVLENVKGLRETAQGQFERLILASLDQLGYKSAVWELCASAYGVPQKRYRLFFVGRRRGPVPPPPAAEKGIPLTVRDAIADLPRLQVGASEDEIRYPDGTPSPYALMCRVGLFSTNGHLVTMNSPLVQRRYAHIPPGGNWTDIPKRLMRNYTNLVDRRSRHSGIYRRLQWDEPSVVIANFRKNMLIHPEQHRGLSVREAARIQSFYDSYKFLGSIGLQQQQVSNAVPPFLARAVLRQLMAYS